MTEFKKKFKADLSRYGGGVTLYLKQYHYYFRKSQTNDNRMTSLLYRFCYRYIRLKHGIEIDFRTKIGKGLYLGHAYNITINAAAIIGENCNIHRGVVIGQENRGIREGTPIIGNKVWIGINAIIVGNIHIGDDVLIAPNAYVNCDVPDHSIVLGNPCIIKPCDNATEGYISNIV